MKIFVFIKETLNHFICQFDTKEEGQKMINKIIANGWYYQII